MSFFYAVRNGYKRGIYRDWPSAKRQVDGFPGAKYKKFKTHEEAKYFMETGKEPEKSRTIKLKSNGSFVVMNNEKDNKKENNVISVWTDGSCLNNGKTGSRGGIGIFFAEDDPRNVSKPLTGFDCPSNQKAELMAILKAMSILLKTEDSDKKRVKIYTDSAYSINVITKWASKWKQNNFKTVGGQPVKNLDLIKKILKTYEKMLTRFEKVTFDHTRSHTAEPKNKKSQAYMVWYGNDQADKFARKAAIKISK